MGELATAIQKVEGKQIEISARKGSFKGVTEYAVKTLKAIDGTAVDVRDTPKPVGDTRPEKPAMQVRDNYVLITIPQGVTQEQLNRITDVARKALDGL